MSSTPFGQELPQLAADNPPLFVDAAACRDWMYGIATEQAHQTQALLLRQLNLLNRYALPVADRYAILELLSAAVQTANEESAQRFISKPLPLTPPEQAAFDTCQTLWQALETGYLHCLQEFVVTDRAAADTDLQQGAQAAARALSCLSAAYFDACRAALLPASGFWSRLHRLYQVLEQRQMAHLSVEPMRGSPTTSTITTPLQLYIETLLLAAAHPLELEPTQLTQVAHWTRLWAHKIVLRTTPPTDLRTPPLTINLAGDAAGAFKSHPVATEHLRWLDMVGLRLTLKQTFSTLEKGHTVESLWLDQDALMTFGLVLLRQVYQDWCRGGRHNSGKKTTGSCQLVAGFDAIHQHLAAVTMPSHSPTPASGTTENWQKLREHVSTLQLQRPLNQSGKRLVRSQLIALVMYEGEPLLIGQLQQVAINNTREHLLADIHILPGQPEAISLKCRTDNIRTIHPQHQGGFLLPAIPSLNVPASILLSPQSYKPEQAIHITTASGERKIYLGDALDHGVDFVRCSFVEG
jgi:hypothetical protein